MVYARARNINMYDRAINKRAFNLCNFTAEKKIEIFSFSLLHIRTAYARLCSVPTEKGTIIRSLKTSSRKEKRLDALIAR